MTTTALAVIERKPDAVVPEDAPAKVTLVQIAEFFGIPKSAAVKEMKALTSDDRAQLALGIGDGSLTY